MIDILVPVASYPKFLEATLSSIRLQNHDNLINVYVLENNSQDSLASAQIRHLADKYSCNYIFFRERLPQLENWNRCLNVGKSNWVHFLHDDDVWPSFYLDPIIKLLHAKSLIISSLECVDSGFELDLGKNAALATPKSMSKEELMAYLLINDIHVSACLFKRTNIRFRSLMKVAYDQDFIRRHALSLNANDVSILSGNSVKIRLGQHQYSSMPGIYTHAAPDNFRINNYTLKSCLDDPNFDLSSLVKHLCNSSDSSMAVRVLASWSPTWPLKESFYLLVCFLRTTNSSLKTLLSLFLRLLFQWPVWSVKLFLKSPKLG